MTPPRLAGIYCRLSYAPDGSLENVERQEADCRRLGDRLAWPISEQHVESDNNRSAWQRNRRRPGWDRLLRAIDDGEIDGLIVYHGDRLIRQPYDLERLLQVAESKSVRIASVSGTRNLDSADDRFILRIEAAQACKSSDDTSRRVRRGWEARAKRGLPIGGGKRPFGFERDMVTRREEECAVLAEAAERLLAGQSQRGVLRWMNEVSVTSQGGQWNGRGLKHLLTAPRIAGLVEHEGHLYEAVWKPVIDAETWEALKLALRASAEANPYQGQERRYLLSGWATCPTGHPLTTKPTGGRNRKGARIYWCKTPGCPTSVGRTVEHLDAYVVGHVVELLNDRHFIETFTAADGSIAAEIVRLERRRDGAREQLANLAEHEAVDPALLASSLASFDRKIGRLRERAAASERQRLLTRLAGISADEFLALDIDMQAAAVRATYRVVVSPTSRRGPGFDVDAVDLVPIEA